MSQLQDAAFERLFREYQKPITNYIFRLVGDPDEAQELAQDVFVKAYRALPELPAKANVCAWLYRIATNTAYDALRRRRLIAWLPFFPNNEPALMVEGFEARVVEHLTVHQALGQLPVKYRAPLILYTCQGFSVSEVAEILGISQAAVKTRLFRAREMFRQAYQESAR